MGLAHFVRAHATRPLMFYCLKLERTHVLILKKKSHNTSTDLPIFQPLWWSENQG
jgi:hypothetical protein